MYIPHPKYTIDKIYIEPEMLMENDSTIKFDSLFYHYKLRKNDSVTHSFYYIRTDHKSLSPHVLANALLFYDGQIYNQDMVDLSYKRFIGMPVFRSVSFNFVPSNPSQILKGAKPLLDSYIKLSPNPRHVLSLGTEGTNSGGQLGMGFNTVYNNRNLFRGAELFHFRINIAAEVQSNLPSGSNKFLVFNTFSSSFDAGVDLPRLLAPFAKRGIIKSTLGRTSINMGFGFENRPDYRRNVTTLSYLYQWGNKDNVKHTLVPFEINYVSIVKDASFADYLNSRSDPQYVSQYTNHFISLIRYGLVMSNQLMPKDRDFHLWRFNVETAGNLPYTYDRMSRKDPGSIGYFTRFGVRYSQYVRIDLEYRKYWAVTARSSVAYRVGGGLGIPYGNSNSLPFEKGFYLGGSNDMRGWELRSMGPGTYQSPTISYDRTGDIMFITDLEFRFPIYSFLKGAVFADAGNIWLRRDNADFPGGKFYADKVLNSLALDAGTGLRFDFSFFIFRIDLAWKIKQPSMTNQWITPANLKLRNAVWNFGIGYPF